MVLYKRSETVRDFNGVVVSKVSVKVVTGDPYSETAPLASLFQDAAGLIPQANPLTADAAGQYSYWAAGGMYSEKVSRPGYYSITNDGFLIGGEKGDPGPQGNPGTPGAPGPDIRPQLNDGTNPANGSGMVAHNESLMYPAGSIGKALKNRLFTTDLAETMNPTTGANMVGFNSTLAYAAGTVGKFLKDLGSSIGATLVGYLAPFTGAVARTQASKNADIVDARDSGADPTGVVDATAKLNGLLSSGAKVVTGGGGTYLVSASIVVPAGITLRDITVKLADANFRGVVFNTGSVLDNVAVVGTSRLNQYPNAQIGIADQSGQSTGVCIRAKSKNCNINFDFNGTSNSMMDLISESASGQSGVSEGYGCILYQQASRNIVKLVATGDARHSLYISSGSSGNDCTVTTYGTKYSASVQINSYSSQPPCYGNTVRGSDYGSYQGVIIACSDTSGDIGGGVQDNVVEDFEVVALAAATGSGVANAGPAYLMSINSANTVSSGNGFVRCKARGTYNSTTQGVIELSGGCRRRVESCSIIAICKNTSTASFFLNDSFGAGVDAVTGLTVDLMTSAAGIVGIQFYTLTNYIYLANISVTIPGVTKTYFSGTTATRVLGPLNTYMTTATVTAVPGTSSSTVNVAIPAHLASNTRCVAAVRSQGISANALTQVNISAFTSSTVTLTVYNGYSSAQDVSVDVLMAGLP